MKKVFISIVIIANIHFCNSQEIIDLHYNPEKKVFEDKTDSVKFRYGTMYQVKVHNISTSYMSYKLESKSYILSSSTPDILKLLFVGITDEGAFYPNDETKGLKSKDLLDEVYLNTIINYNNLNKLKSNSDSLYNWSLKKPNTILAASISKIVLGIFNVDSLPQLKRKVNLTINYIEAAKEFFKAKMPEINTKTLINERIIKNYAEISYVADLVKSDNYYKYVKFIESSLKPQETILSKPFKAEKDVVDLKITLIDNYKPDTLFNSTVSFYTHGNLSFDFSTGFFCNNLHEDSFYLEPSQKDTVTYFIENDEINFDISFGALGHLSYKLTNYLKLGISLGAAISPLDGKTRFLFGPSLLFGRKKQVGINGGFIFAGMKALDNSVISDDTEHYVSKLVSSVPTYDKITRGFYFGLTYNLTSKKK